MEMIRRRRAVLPGAHYAGGGGEGLVTLAALTTRTRVRYFLCQHGKESEVAYCFVGIYGPVDNTGYCQAHQAQSCN